VKIWTSGFLEALIINLTSDFQNSVSEMAAHDFLHFQSENRESLD